MKTRIAYYLLLTSAMMLLWAAIQPHGTVARQEKQENCRMDDIRVVKAFLEEQRAGFSSSWTEKQVNRYGDRTAVALVKIYTMDELKEAKNLRLVLPVVRSSFYALQATQVPSDQRPDVTLLLLKQLLNEVTDQELKTDISQTIVFVKEQFTKETSKNNS